MPPAGSSPRTVPDSIRATSDPTRTGRAHYSADLPARQRSGNHGRPRSNSERGVHTYPGNRVLGTHAHAADRIILDRQALAPSSAAACRTRSVILTAKPIASHSAEGERREPGQNDPDAAGVLDLDSGPEMAPALSHPTLRNPAGGLARERRSGAGRGPDRQTAGGHGSPSVHPLFRRHAERQERVGRSRTLPPIWTAPGSSWGASATIRIWQYGP
jgi:hypothetical protein